MEYFIAKWLHILSSTLLFGTGLGSAYYMFFASLTRDPRVVLHTVKYVVIADWLFTTTTVIFQPLSGLYLVHIMGVPLTSKWIVCSILLFLVAGAAWLPVVWMQIQMRNMARVAVADNAPLPDRYWRFLKAWVALGIVAFVALIIVFYLMVAKPA
jgi:uncharacterized membrane protein